MRVFLVGLNGKMGRTITTTAPSLGMRVVGGLDVVKSGDLPVFEKATDVNVEFDAIIDFSRPSTLKEVIALAESRKVPVVIATTGYNDEQLKAITELSKKVPVFRSANMSVGVNVVESVLTKLASALSGFDIEIVEAHHNQKVDAPSGTALQMLESVKSGLNYTPNVIYGRSGESKRQEGDIGMHAVRGGTIVGEHTVIFAGDDEIIEIKHTALSRRIFALGSLKAVKFLADKKPALYTMSDYINHKI